MRLDPRDLRLRIAGVRRLLALAALVVGLGAAAQAQTGTISGLVTDSTTALPLPAASVTVLDEAGVPVPTLGASTDADGEYEIENVPAGTYTVRASFVGFDAKTQTVAVLGGQTATANFALSSGGVALGDVVVVGYGEQRRRDVTGSVGSVDGEEIAEQATPSVGQALQGRVAGVTVTPSTGDPGAGAEIRVRGVGTLNNADPLFVVDGLLLDDIDFLNPNDVASVEVLKDASATAIYGSRGANGVIIVTTKRGIAGAAPVVEVNAYSGVQSLQRDVDLVTADQYVMLANELATNEGFAMPFPDGGAGIAGTDWQDVVYDAAPIRNVNVGVRGGTDNVSYYVSGDVISQDGIIGGSSYSRATLRVNNEYRVGDLFAVGHNVNLIYRDGTRAPVDIVRTSLLADPTVAPGEEGAFNDAGVRASAGNPAATLFYNRNDEGGFRLAGNVFLDLDLPLDLSFRSNFGLDLDGGEYKSFAPSFFVAPTQQNETSALLVEQASTDTWLWENTVSYNFLTPDSRHRLDAVAGFTLQSFYSEFLLGTRQNIIGEDPSFWYLSAGEAEGQTVSNDASSWTMQSYLGRVNYALLDRYLATVSFRVDGSSRFGTNNRYGAFPSVGLAWNVAEETFMDGLPAVSALKLRGSYGVIGNDKIDPYAALALVTGDLNAVFGRDPGLNFGQSPISLSNSDIRWEEVEQVDVGLDAALFDSRLTATLDYYSRDTNGILVGVPIPAYVGSTGNPIVNAASVRNSGLEAAFAFGGQLGGLRFDLGVNGATIRNEVLSLGGGNEQILAGGLGNEVTITNRTVVGEPIGSFYGYQVAGVFQTQEEIDASPTLGSEEPGDLQFADTNGDGAITADDKVNLGSPIPDYTLGFNVDLAFGGFDLRSTFSGAFGQEAYNARTSVRFGVDNFETSVLDRWTGPGTSTDQPRLTNAGHNFQASSRFVEDASFLKLQVLQLGYSVPARYLSAIGASRARLYVSGTNLVTFTGYDGYTPEIGGGYSSQVDASTILGAGIDRGIYPIARTVSLGVNLVL